MDPDGNGGGKEVGEVEGGKIIIRIYYVRKKLSSIKAKRTLKY